MDHPLLVGKLAKALGPLALATALLSGCGAPDQSTPPSAAAPTAAPPTRAAPQPGDRLYIRDGFKGDTERLSIIDSVSGARERELPPGVIAPDWSTLYVAEQTDGKTTVRALDLASGRTLRETMLDGAYALPMITPESVMGGLSPNGSWLALHSTPAQPGGTQFVVLDTAFKQKPRLADLKGYFLFDGLNNSGRWLFLTESLGPDPTAKYQVRRYDLANGVLDPQVIVEKGEQSGVMSGARQTAVASKHGDWLYSLYLDTHHGPFIHALPIDDTQFAFCIDLPKNSKEDLTKQSHWSLVMNADKRTLYAVNGALGLVVEYNLSEGLPQMVQTKTLFDTPANTSGQAAPKTASSNVTALAPDGKTLYTIGEQGLLVLDTKDLRLRGRYLPDWSLDGVALSPDGARLYAASAAQGKIVRLDPSAGTIAAEVPAAGQPSGVLRVEAHK